MNEANYKKNSIKFFKLNKKKINIPFKNAPFYLINNSFYYYNLTI